MSIPIECECGFADKVPDKWAGKRVKCKCGRKIEVPQSAAIAEGKPAGAKPGKAKKEALKPASEQKGTADAAERAPRKPSDKTPSKRAEPKQTSPDDLSELVSGELPAKSGSRPASVQPKAAAEEILDDLDVVEEFEELEELDELEDLDDLDEFDMREEDDLDMAEPAGKEVRADDV